MPELVDKDNQRLNLILL